ncbi:unnamed protein product [Phytophthora lilii]|uniref:Unnamed protein product n=1 Tax=Phytophthora lilii TaxID=2077276 RepID=A0A9W6XC77_9STRA|nr:unnamed protein product [Phytophthora lilii]
MSDTTQLADSYLLQSALKTDPPVDVSKGKSVAVVFDGNQGGYTSGLIQIDATSQLTGSKGYASLKDAYLTLPYVITAKETAGSINKSTLSRFACALKCNVANVVDSLTVKLNGKKVITETEYKGFWNNLRAMTELSQDEIAKHGADMHLYPDSWTVINFTKSASATGDGYSNNQIYSASPLDTTLSQAQEPWAYNGGFFKRLTNTPAPIDSTQATGAFSWASFGSTATKNMCQQNGRGAFQEADATSYGNDKIVGTWYHLLKIRLVDLHPIFKELDLCANPQLKLRLRINTGVVAISGTSSTMKLDSATMTAGTTVPIMVAPATAAAKTAAGDTITPAAPMNDILATGAQLSFAFGPVGNSFTNTSKVGEYLPYAMSRLHIPFYHIKNPSAIIQKPIKTIRYLDCFAQLFPKAAGTSPDVPTGQLNAAFDLTVSGYKKNVKYVALIPFADTTAGHFASVSTVRQYQSPFDSAPWTCMPGASIRNFQVQLGNENVFTSSHEYDFESFMDEFSKLGAINGDLSHEISNGLIDSVQWSMAQRILVADCSRISKKDVPQSLQISGINGSATGMDLLVLVVLELDRLTGEIHRTD